MKTTEEMIEVMNAYKEGKKIECKNRWLTRWIQVEHPVWNWYDNDYRVKPEPEYVPYVETFERCCDKWKKEKEMSIICRVKTAVHSGRLDAKDGEKIIEALEKQKPKKPKRNFSNMFHDYPICPCCNRYFYFKYNDEYCSKCGQRLDWSDAE